MKTHWILTCSLFIMIFVGCAESQNSDLLGNFRFYEEFRAKKIFSQSIVTCPTGDCPSFVGGLYIMSFDKLKGYKVGGCSASLIGSDQVLSNAHCIPENISRVGGSCQGHIRIVFPKTDEYPPEVFGCQKILNASLMPKKPGNPDWVILKLDKPSVRKLMAFDLNGIQSMEPVTLYKINFNMNNLSPSRGTVVRANCFANTNHILSTHFLGPVSPFFDISDCNQRLIPGNSGSAVLNKEGKFIGIFSFISSKSTNLPPDFEWAEESTGGGTNGACIPFENHHIPERCEFDKKEYNSLAVRHARWLRKNQSGQIHNMVMKIHEKNILQYKSVIKFTRLDPRAGLTGLFFNVSPPMALLKGDFISQALPLALPSFSECVHQEAGPSFQAVLGTRVPDYLERGSLLMEGYCPSRSTVIYGSSSSILKNRKTVVMVAIK